MADYLTEAFVRLRQKLKSLSGGMLPDTYGVDDILQDCFVRLWRHQYPIHSENEAEALLRRTVKNASLNERRRQKTVPLDASQVKEPPEEDSPDYRQREESYNEMRRLIQAKLSPTQRYILEEKEYGSRTLEDIANELGMEPPAVRMQLSRARKILREALKDKLNHE